MTGSSLRIGALGVLLAATAAGCGGGARQDADETAGTYQVRVVKASFPARQHVSQQAHMRVEVRNSGRRTIPAIAVTVRGFDHVAKGKNLQDPSRPTWIIDDGPRGGDTAYVSTWALGKLRPGASTTFEWTLTPVIPGRHRVSFEIAAGLDGKARVQSEGGRPPGRAFAVDVSGRAPQATVDPATGNVVTR